MMGPKIALLTLLVLAVSCSPTIKRTEALHSFTVPDEWTGGDLLDGPGESAWWTYFGDSQLDHAVTTALSDNINLRAAVARVEAATQDVVISGADLYPSADISASRGRQRQNFVGFPIPGGEEEVLSSISSNAKFSLNLSWEADLWGRVRAGKMGAIATLESREADLAGAHLSLTAQVAKAFFTAVEADRQVILTKATVASYETSTERIRARFEMGLRQALDLRLALTELERSRALLEQRLEQRDRAIRQLQILMGGYPNGDLPLSEDLPPTPGSVPSGIPSQLVNRRPDVVAAERNWFAVDTRVHQSKADLKPRFALTSAGGTASDDLKSLLNTDFLIWSFVGNLSQPLFNGGRLRATVKKSEAQAREAAANYESVLLTAYGEVESALAAERVLERRESAMGAATREAQAAKRLSEERYRLGLTDIVTLLSAQRTALDSEISLLTVRRLRLENRVNLHLALGGGFEAVPSRLQLEQEQKLKQKRQQQGGEDKS